MGVVKISFFGTIDFGRVGVPSLTHDKNLLVADPADVFALKLQTILERPSVEDYVDIATLIKEGFDIEKALSSASLFYGSYYNPAFSLRALCFFDDLNPRPPEEVMTILKNEVKEKWKKIQSSGLPEIQLKSKKLGF